MCVVIRDQKWLADEIRDRAPNNDRLSRRSYTADFAVKTWRRKLVYTSFERGESRDHRYIKIFSFTCKIVVNELKQDEAIFCCRN